jgi:hypothetical protein
MFFGLKKVAQVDAERELVALSLKGPLFLRQKYISILIVIDARVSCMSVTTTKVSI